ncbi:MAG: hypothetical protein NHB32_18885 [Fischerella sp. CENA71]|nr:hypothetical protein [Fischerella sp. CENA71]
MLAIAGSKWSEPITSFQLLPSYGSSWAIASDTGSEHTCRVLDVLLYN